MAMSVETAAKALIHNFDVNEGLLNKVEMAFRAYDPCHACATHSLPGQMPLIIQVMRKDGSLLEEVRR
jgi:F420-non-reducing hydrogenase large subunit